MKGNKLFYSMSIVVILAMVLAACGGGATTAAPTQPPPPTTAPATAVPATAVSATEAPTGCQDIDAFDAAAAPTDKAVKIAYSQEPDNLVGYYSNMTYSAWVGQMTQPGLAEWNENSDYVPDLAAEIPTVENGGMSADGLVFTWHLKPDLHWSDGKCLTSEDVKFTFESIMNEKNTVLSRAGYDKMASVEAPDETTVVITFSEPYAPWQLLFTSGPNTAHPILPKHILEGLDTLDAADETHMPTVTAGAFVPQEWVHLTLVANPNFYGGKPKMDAVFIKFVPDPETALAALQTGDTDLYPDFSESDIPTLEALEPTLHLGVEMRIPESYVPEIHQRLGLYKRLSEARAGAEMEALRAEIRDRFGPLPPEVEGLLTFAALRPRAEAAGVSQVDFLGGRLVVRFSPEFALPSLPALVRSLPGATLTPQALHIPLQAGEDAVAGLGSLLARLERGL